MPGHIKFTIVCLVAIFGLVAGYVWADMKFGTVTFTKEVTSLVETPVTAETTKEPVKEITTPVWPEILDTEEYDKRILTLSGYVPPTPVMVLSTSTTESGAVITRMVAATTTTSSSLKYSSTTNVTIDGQKWPPAAPYPYGGAILPFKRILAYYGNFIQGKWVF